MSRLLIFCQTKNPDVPKLQVRGAFTQKKKLWDIMVPLMGGMTGWKVVDDVSGRGYDASYQAMCGRLRTTGRATFLDPGGRRVFLILDAVSNEVRDWDTSDDGLPVPNPAMGFAGEKVE